MMTLQAPMTLVSPVPSALLPTAHKALSLGQFRPTPAAYTGIGSTVPASPSFWNLPCNVDFTFTSPQCLASVVFWNLDTRCHCSLAVASHMPGKAGLCGYSCKFYCQLEMQSPPIHHPWIKAAVPLWVDEYEKIFSVDSLI